MKAIAVILSILILCILWLLPMILFLIGTNKIGDTFHNTLMFFISLYWNILTFYTSGWIASKFYEWFVSNLK